MRASMTHREYSSWRLYWDAEPWGPYRDNLHTAILAREVRRPQVRKGTRITHDEFMVRNPEERRRESSSALIGFLRSVSKRKPREPNP